MPPLMLPMLFFFRQRAFDAAMLIFSAALPAAAL